MSRKRLSMFVMGVVVASVVVAAHYGDWSPPENLGPVVNSAADDNSATISKDGLRLYFTSNRPGGMGGNDIYVAYRSSVDAPWGPPMNLGPIINSSFGDNAPTFSRDGHTVFFNSTRPGGTGGGNDLWMARRANTHDDFYSWEEPFPLPANVNSAFLDAAPEYFVNDETGVEVLYFSTQRPAAFAGSNIFSTEIRADGTFSDPFPVPGLNTDYVDGQPALRHDGREIVFQSNRPGGMDPTDFFVDLWSSTRESADDEWSTPVNLGPTVNTPLNDLNPGLNPDGTELIFGSPRGGSGGQDLFVSRRLKKNAASD